MNKFFTIALLMTEFLISLCSVFALFYTENPAYLLTLLVSAAAVLYAAGSLMKYSPALPHDYSTHYHIIYMAENIPRPRETGVPYNRRW